MSWIWGEKKKEPKKTKLEFTTNSAERHLIKRTVKVQVEFQVEYPMSVDIVQAFREIHATFETPMGVEIKDAHMDRIEILGGSNV
jgi:hypothetical protein